MVEVTISNSAQNFFNLTSDDIVYMLCDYLKVEEKDLINSLEDLSKESGCTLSWIVEYIIIKTHYKDLYATNHKHLLQYSSTNQ